MPVDLAIFRSGNPPYSAAFGFLAGRATRLRRELNPRRASVWHETVDGGMALSLRQFLALLAATDIDISEAHVLAELVLS